jgi:hypothetical protein
MASDSSSMDGLGQGRGYHDNSLHMPGNQGDNGMNQYGVSIHGDSDTTPGNHGDEHYLHQSDVHIRHHDNDPDRNQHGVRSRSMYHVNPTYQDDEEAPTNRRPLTHSISLSNHRNNNSQVASQSRDYVNDLIIGARLRRHFRKVNIEALLDQLDQRRVDGDYVDDDTSLQRHSTLRSLASVYPSDTLGTHSAACTLNLRTAVATLMKGRTLRSYGTKRIFIKEQLEHESVLFIVTPWYRVLHKLT